MFSLTVITAKRGQKSTRKVELRTLSTRLGDRNATPEYNKHQTHREKGFLSLLWSIKTSFIDCY